jgi:hypothetical protein
VLHAIERGALGRRLAAHLATAELALEQIVAIACLVARERRIATAFGELARRARYCDACLRLTADRSIWASMVPAKAERADDLDFERLANELVMSGGYIKNAVLRAAFLAAEDDAPITNKHLWRAARCEYESMGKISFQPMVAKR